MHTPAIFLILAAAASALVIPEDRKLDRRDLVDLDTYHTHSARSRTPPSVETDIGYIKKLSLLSDAVTYMNDQLYASRDPQRLALRTALGNIQKLPSQSDGDESLKKLLESTSTEESPMLQAVQKYEEVLDIVKALTTKVSRKPRYM